MNEPNIQKKSHYLPGSTFATGIVARFIDRVLGNLYYEKEEGGEQVIALVDDDQKMVVRRTLTEIMVAVQVKIKEFRGCGSWITETSLWVTLSFGKLNPFIYFFQELFSAVCLVDGNSLS